MIFVSLEMTPQLRIASASILNGMIKRSYNRRPLGNAEGLVVWGCMYRTCPDVIVLMDLRASLSSRSISPLLSATQLLVSELEPTSVLAQRRLHCITV